MPRYLLIKDAQVKEAFLSFDAAYDWGLQQRMEPFLVVMVQADIQSQIPPVKKA